MRFSIDDQLTWRVTPENPIREMDGMDWERCAALHNLIVRLGWTGMGNSDQDMPTTTWWQANITHNSLEAEWSRRLSPSLKLFLQTAYETPHENFFYYARGLNGPRSFFVGVHEQEDSILGLYQMTNLNLSGHRDGLNFNQKTSRAIFCSDVLDSFPTTNGRMEWDPLEVVLSAWLDMIDTGKVIARPKGTSARGPLECTPWELLPYSEHDLAHSVNAFNNLVARIECLLEDESLRPLDNLDDQLRLLDACTAKLNQPVSQELSGLVSKEVLDRLSIPDGFIRRFLLRVRRPRNIRYIAPGLRFPTPSDFASYPFESFQIPDSMEYDIPVLPIPLFISDINCSAPLLGYPFHELSSLPYGLWMEYCNRDAHHTFEDTCRLYLPFEIGANGFARLTDDSLVGENQGDHSAARPNGRKNELYQPGYCHFIPWHGPQLGNVLELWSNLVGLGEWAVGEEGVLGGIEKFREADTEEHSHKYQIFTKW
ncbi:hypothetical protein UA08_08922 [Talaromyces atroroseus]|uniref:Uncharacterized protein n=1 Tax=Talaromyces atroroseus TaxID=1441469 RepID=A0A225AD40_TALAT|nr:hypothetical protein UA08_08922 [Talaromyces atroroseus]OKL55834.1 hypothetical protein UA08_08922 [Talaromyces atroroseus]